MTIGYNPIVRSERVPAEQQALAAKVFDEARARLEEEGRPLISRWTAMETNRAIRKVRRRRRLALPSLSAFFVFLASARSS